MQDFKNLKVWQKALELALFTYRITADFPRDELFGLRNTLRKTSLDVPACIAEGCAKTTDGEFARPIAASVGLGNRLEYCSLIARDPQMIPKTLTTITWSGSLRCERCTADLTAGSADGVDRFGDFVAFGLQS